MFTYFPFLFFFYKHYIYSLRVRENGQERTEVEEDGVLKTVLINGNSCFAIVIIILDRAIRQSLYLMCM